MKCKACGCEYSWVEIGDDFCICECGHAQELPRYTKNNFYYCENCEEQEVGNKGDWCDDCNLPERSFIR